ncbi:OLC1v1036294C1 [Oldenlandia corymbosa var. corymbosa]|uniref:OLC1v1036294C1 n=1 Tax=Oldenlandia corymbosa var. corymbosa TaxID=529605 RepID=A0AAV1CY77_OLDCO|nr:OLC1v1036294C1 [Oldenlandia corymbosa var. corymbosa]
MAFKASYEYLRNSYFWVYTLAKFILILVQQMGWPIDPNVEAKVKQYVEVLGNYMEMYNQLRGAFHIPQNHPYLQLQSVADIILATNLLRHQHPINGELFLTPGWHILPLSRRLINESLYAHAFIDGMPNLQRERFNPRYPFFWIPSY